MGRACATHGRHERKRLMEGTLEGRRGQGRPGGRWSDGVERDMRVLGVRSSGEICLTKPRPTQGCRALMMMMMMMILIGFLLAAL
ncbi:jg15188 [Pararge aegeria aegeria]|uniref:Jg15188 protein n=1 Tax=Pararge aegeria aegeria TaxID=348720 RepID=A0A8S4QPS8_9NEOP|nr:jg15188 [Pararge aegeria aegeria]